MKFLERLKKIGTKEKVVSYYRLSKKSDAMYLRQIYVCDAYINEHNYEKVLEFQETISGTVKLDERCDLVDCIVYCIKNNIKKIIVSEADRLSRNVNTFKEIMKMVEPFDIKFILVLDKLDTKNDSNIEKVKNKIEFAEKEVRKIHERLDSGRKKFISNGGKVGRKKGSIKTREQKKEEYPDVIRLLFEEKESIREISKKTGVSVATIQRLKNEFKGEYREVALVE